MLDSLQRLSDNVKTFEKHVPGTFPHGLQITFDKRKEHDLIKGPYDQATSISKIRNYCAFEVHYELSE